MHLESPLSLLKTAASYLSDIDRIKIKNFEQIKKYQNKKFLQLIKYAFNVPLYSQKFKELSIKPEDIKSIEDIVNLPVVNRMDVINSFPHGIIAPDIKNPIPVNTSGSTRNPVSLYVDQMYLMKALIAYAREMRQYGINWIKSRICIIANFYSQAGPTQFFESGTSPVLKIISPFFSLKNIIQINSDDDLLDMTKRINDFNPECILGFPGPLRHIALLKNKGYGDNIKPKCIISTGCYIGKYQKKEIEEVIGARVFDAYGSTEAGPISFECENGSYHINSDFVFLETIDKKGNPIPRGKPGRLAMTRLYGKGTPLIRYTGMGDVVTLDDGACDCGRETELLNRVQGRIKETLVLPNNRVIYPTDIEAIHDKVIYQLKANEKIYKLQVVQEKIDRIRLLIIIREEKRGVGVSVEDMFNTMKEEYQKVLGKDVDFDVLEVNKLKSEDLNEESTPGILTKIDADKYIA